jgi:hypothetical protein
VVDDPELHDFDFEELQRRATEHREVLVQIHRDAARGLVGAGVLRS